MKTISNCHYIRNFSVDTIPDFIFGENFVYWVNNSRLVLKAKICPQLETNHFDKEQVFDQKLISIVSLLTKDHEKNI